MTKGIIYITFGQKSLDMALISLRSFKRYNPLIPATIFTDLTNDTVNEFNNIYNYSDTELSEIDFYFKKPNKFSSLKVRFLHLSPYKNTLYLDADTYVKGNLDEIFGLLDSNELITTLNAEWKWSDDAYLTHNHSNNNKKQGLINLTSRDENNINCGVICYKNADNMKKFFDIWWSNFQDNSLKNEQGILQQLLRKEILKTLNINRINIDNKIYNCVGSMWPRIHSLGLWDNCKILHSQRIFLNQHLNVNDLYKLDYLQKFK
jgi:hypothetical protein